VQISLFHEPWWLSAVTDGRYEEAVFKQGSDIVGRLPYVVVRLGPFRTLRMPPFTHVLGPAVDAGVGKPQTRLIRRLSITRSLIDQLPSSSYFLQLLDPSLDEGLASADGLAFQERNFAVAPHYTFEVDCRRSLDDIWAAMQKKTRQPIRRAKERFSVRCVDRPQYFVDFYLKNTEAGGRVNGLEFKSFSALFSECRARGCGVILGAFDHDASPVAMTYLVWGRGIMYYLLSTRSRHGDYGAVSLLLWSAMKRAHQLGLVLDFDGVYSSGTVRFLSGFGGRIKTRLLIRRTEMPFRALQLLKRHYARDETQLFT
jgi:lipid II:glycine glycyltransferase (peptidoglycan interpeptide bridge formation enzyme)